MAQAIEKLVDREVYGRTQSPMQIFPPALTFDMFVRDVLGKTTSAISDGQRPEVDNCCLSMTRLVYIGGYGRSGSTLLEYLLTG